MATCMADVLPNELLTSILVCLSASEIKICRLVCRRLKKVIALSPSLQFIIELDNAGYVAATNSRTDLSLDGKLKALRLHNSRRVNHAVNSIDAFKIGISNGGFSMRRELLTSPWAPLFKDGMIAQWSSVSSDSYMPLQLDLVQLPSLNTGTELKQWRITQQDMNIRSYDIEPACDLLVLLEYTSADTPPFTIPILTPEEQVHRYLFHFRTLSTNQVHPSAIVGTLDCNLRGNSGWGFPVNCRGDLIIARPEVAGPSQFMSDDGAGLVIYNWTTGALLDLRNATFPKFLAVLSNEVIVIPRSTFTYSSRNIPMGVLDIYFIDWSDTPSLSLVAVLELPIVASVPIPPPGLHGISGDHIAIFCRCFPGSGFFSSQEAPYALGPPRVFEPSESSQLMRMQFSLPYLGLNQGSRGRLASLLYIPFQVLYETVASGRRQFSETGLPRRVPWEEWGPNTRWFHSKLWDNALLQSRGSRSMLTRHYPPRAEGPARLDLYVVDFNPAFVKAVEYRQSQRASNKDVAPEPGTWVFQPRETNELSPTGSNVYQQVWLGECGADKAVAPYAWLQVKSEYLDRIAAHIQEGATVMMDNEHIVVIPVCRRLKYIIGLSRLLFIAELDAAGYVEASNSRKDLDTMEKYKYLHLHQTQQKGHTISSTETLKLGVLNGGFQTRFHSLTDNDAPKLKGGILAKWSSVNSSSYLPLQLDIVQLASLNLGSESKQWNLVYKDMNIRDYDIEPACDLLVLLEYTGPALDPFDPNAFPPTFDTEGLGGGTPKPYVIHFRTLSTNEPHPSAIKPSLDGGIITGNAWGFQVTCLGEVIVARPKCTPSGVSAFDSQSGLIIYNWTTGALLDQKDALYTSHLVVLSDQVLVMPRSSFTYGSQNALMGELDLHCIDWSDTSNPMMTHVIILELPFVHSIPPILAEHQNQLTPAHIAMTITCHSEPSFSSSRSAPYARGTSRIFEPVKYNQLLRVRVRLPQVESAFIPGVPGMNRLSGDTSVYVPYHTVFSAVEVGKKREGGVQRVHWEDWAPSVRWVHLEPEFWEGQPRATNGSRCMLTRHSMEHYTTNWQDPNKRHTYDVYLLDFNPMFLDELAHRDDEERINENGSGKWVYQPAEPDLFSPITSNVERRTWLAECGAEKASAPYAWSKFKHEYFDTVVAQLQNTKVMFDDEHIVVIEVSILRRHVVIAQALKQNLKGEHGSGQMSKIVVFNF